MTTAAGTITPAKVLVVGAGVAGLQAIATARRMGAVVSAYDVRAAVKEQVQSLGAKFVEMPLDTNGGEAKGGYAQAMDEEFYRRQRELMTKVVAESDVVITTAAVPGKKAPTLITAEMVAGMAAGAVIVDVAAERGGNCALTRPGETVVEHGVTILGPANLPSDVPYHASQLFAKNITTFLAHLLADGKLQHQHRGRDHARDAGGQGRSGGACEGARVVGVAGVGGGVSGFDCCIASPLGDDESGSDHVSEDLNRCIPSPGLLRKPPSPTRGEGI